MLTSTTEAEYIALGHIAKEAVWIRQFINKITLDIVSAITLNGDNEIISHSLRMQKVNIRLSTLTFNITKLES